MLKPLFLNCQYLNDLNVQDSDLKEIAGCYRLNQLLLFYSLVKIPYTEQPLCGQSFHSTLKTFI